MDKVQGLLRKGAVVEQSHQDTCRSTRFYSDLFLVPEKSGGMRLVIWKTRTSLSPKSISRWRNAHLDYKAYLKDAYFMIPLHEKNRAMLRSLAQDHLFQFTCLPLGLSWTTWVFTKTLRIAISLLRELRIQHVVYTFTISWSWRAQRPKPGNTAKHWYFS